MLDASLGIESPRGEAKVLLRRGAALPAEATTVFATQRAGEREIAFKLVEGDERALVAVYKAALPAGLPANTWLTVIVRVGEDHVVRATVRERLRRIDVDAEADATGATAKVLRALT